MTHPPGRTRCRSVWIIPADGYHPCVWIPAGGSDGFRGPRQATVALSGGGRAKTDEALDGRGRGRDVLVEGSRSGAGARSARCQMRRLCVARVARFTLARSDPGLLVKSGPDRPDQAGAPIRRDPRTPPRTRRLWAGHREQRGRWLALIRLGPRRRGSGRVCVDRAHRPTCLIEQRDRGLAALGNAEHQARAALRIA